MMGVTAKSPGRSANEVARLFFSKKKQRTVIFPELPIARPCLDLSAGAEIKVFWFFSSEKNKFFAML
jgi:hypothetical protein